ncbi:progranulin-like [Liolophura sinensis]|uniref:progranulin-like n=1 Tax=Liolophura sinensis TaxID=3198878 RepID=UPI0031596238
MYRFCVLTILVIQAAADTLYFSQHEDVNPAQPASSDGVMCPDGRSECAIGQTCCQLNSGAYGCCPYPKAVCCKDHLHCCPERSRCDLRRKKCSRREEQLPLAVHLPARLVDEDNTNHLKKEIILLTEEENELQQEENKLIENKITLTEEKIKLTEEEIQLALNENQLTQNNVKLIQKEEVMTENKVLLTENELGNEVNVTLKKDVVCPGGQSQCPEGSTCCKLASGQYGCCPLPKAVCCSDHTHCCPSGTTCDTSQGKCNRGEISTPWLKKQPALPRVSVSNVVCPDGQSQCPDGSTCCKLASGQYGCCPLPKAVCCSDHTHCCPSGTTCDTSQGKCNRGEISTPWLKKQPALSRASVGSVVCPDGQSQCPDKSTCCKLASGQYGCCPLPKAVCCSDHTHCCPSGTTCDTSQGKCNRGEISTPWLKKQPALSRASVGSVVCPDGQSQCPDKSTCCKLASGQYGCCPLPKAVCCSDHTHCCPSGTTCDTSQGKCNRGEISTPWLKKQPALSRASVGSVVCPDGQSQCPDKSTCCKLASGQYGCCPLTKAVCCSDHIHCCLSGTTCDVSKGQCLRGYSTIRWHEMPLSRPVSKLTETDIKCPDGQSECPDGNTCCKLPSGEYGCCPLPKAVCCSDHTHCCPTGTTCDVKEEKCIRGHSSFPWVTKLPARPSVKSVQKNIECPDGQSQCPDTSTCCKLASGQYGCCPFPKAQCCSDHRHCCPQGSSCDVSKGSCDKGEVSVPWAEKQLAVPKH